MLFEFIKNHKPLVMEGTLAVILLASLVAIFFSKKKSARLFRVAAVLTVFDFFGVGLFVGWKSWPKAVMTSAQMVTINADYGTIFDGVKSRNQSKPVCQKEQAPAEKEDSFDLFFWIFSVACILTPLVWGGALLNVFFDVLGRIRYFAFKFFRPCYFFSELRENSLRLAKSLSAKNKGKCLCLFFGVGSDVNPELREEAKSNGFLIIKDSEVNFLRKPDGLRREQFYFEISKNQDQNVSHAKQLIERYAKKYGEADYRFLKIFVFSEQEETPFVMGSIDKKGIPVQIVDRNRFFAYDLFFRTPLYSALSENEKTISLLILGGTEMGKTLFKTAVWCGQLGGEFHLKITLLDKNADAVESQLKLECPEIFSKNYDVRFITSEANSYDFAENLNSKCTDVNYACVCFDDDALNIQTALRLRAYYLEKSKTFEGRPKIAVYVKDGVKNELLPEFSIFSKERRNRDSLDVASERKVNYNLIPFGGDNQLYSCALVDSELEELAFNIHYAYEAAFDNSVSESAIRKRYWENETNLRSDRANALHIKYKIFALGFDIAPLRDAAPLQIAESGSLLSELEAKLSEAADSERPWLAMLEHDRWRAFMESEGWRPMPLEDAEKRNSHKNIMTKRHACLCSWDALDDFKRFDSKFKEYDKRFVRDIPILVGLVDGVENISGVKYVLIRKSF